jgi:ribosomal-protein-alanine N-acetyltransferase
MRHPSSLIRRAANPRLDGARVMLRPLTPHDYAAWREVRIHNEQWLLPWEPQRQHGFADPVRDRSAFESRCTARDRERASDYAYPFGVFVDQHLAGEVNLNNVTRGALQSATIGYWIDQRRAGRGYIAEAVVVVARFAFEQLQLHRIEICIVPRNVNSLRVVEKLGLRREGVAERYLEIAGTWEDHARFAITLEEWQARADELTARWLTPESRTGDSRTG